MSRFVLLFYALAVLFFSPALQGETVSLTSDYRIDTMWATAYQATVKLTNSTNQATTGWTATFTLPADNHLSAHVSGGEFFTAGQTVTVKNIASNGSIPAGGSVTFNMIINMPQSGSTVIGNLAAIGEVSGTPTPGLAAPVLNPIAVQSANSYAVSWTSVPNATTYYLEKDVNAQFTNPVPVSQISTNSTTFANQPEGTYYYRVAAGNATTRSPYSNVQSVTVAGATSQVPLMASYKVETVWATAFQVRVTLKNNTSVPVTAWSASFSLPTGFSLSGHADGGVFTVSGQTVTVKNLASNGGIAPNATVAFSAIINKSQSATSQINGLQATGKVNSVDPLPIPSAPILSLTPTSQNDYNVSWTSVPNATSYTLQEDTSDGFPAPNSVVQGNVLSRAFVDKAVGTYWYRAFASNSSGRSDYSNPVSITVRNNPPIPPTSTIEYSEWYIDWTAWFPGPTFVIPSGANMINIFVGELTYGADGKPTMGGFGTFSLPQLKAFVEYLAAQEPPIQAKVSIGGGGGMYDRTWDKLTSSNISAFAQGMVDFCHNLGLVGVDFDYEAFASQAQETLVGRLIKEFKQLDPKLQTSLCSNAGFGPNFPWQQSVKNILDAAMISPGNCALDRFYIMTYYNSMADEIGWVVGADGKGGWANWLITNYGFTRARISVGIDDFDAHAYDPDVFKAWAISEGFSVAHWAFDPARPK